MLILSLLGVFVLLLGCLKKPMADFEITNATSSKIDSLTIGPEGNSTGLYFNIKPSEKIVYQLFLATTPLDNEDEYVISYKMNGETINLPFLYPTNDPLINKLTRITIAKDSIKVDLDF